MFYKLTIAYVGTEYCGWQVQPNAISIQTLIEDALNTILQKKVNIVGSGRTDAGVHALGQVAHFYWEGSLNLAKIRFSLNCLLPKDIRIISVELPSQPFHAQHYAVSKVYRYHLFIKKVLCPFRRFFVWHIPNDFDIEKLNFATQHFLGTHDFTSFTNEAHKGVAAKDPIRTLYRIDINKEGGEVTVEFEGDGFLYKMVRNIVGTLVNCAIGKKDPNEIPAIFHAKDRKKGCMSAPPQGLFLVKVNYPSINSKDSKCLTPFLINSGISG